MNNRIITMLAIAWLLPAASGINASGQDQSPRESRLAGAAERRLSDPAKFFSGWNHLGEIQIDSIWADISDKTISIWFNDPVSWIPVRSQWLEDLRSGIINDLGFRFRNYDIVLLVRGRKLEEYVPNYYRHGYAEPDSSRIAVDYQPVPLVTRLGVPFYEGGLRGTHLAVWPSHGLYYEMERDRWEWQRARLFGTVEDLLPFSFIQPYLLPMLENSGAFVMMPRERDLQTYEVIVDNDGSTGRSEMILSGGMQNEWETAGTGFAVKDTLFTGENPFRMGTHLTIKAERGEGAFVTYIPDIPGDGDYAVYVSYSQSEHNVPDVSYSVHHTGGTTEFLVNQTIGAGTWIYLGTFTFIRGTNTGLGSVVISGTSQCDGYITTDAIRFGGGMGNVARRSGMEDFSGDVNVHYSKEGGSEARMRIISPDLREWKTSGRPRYMEGARYYLQYSGMPDSTVYSFNKGMNDYNDDFMSRGEWVNYISGSPMTVTGKPHPESPRIPVDLALGFHTDAGITPCDSVIGTLAIYSTATTDGIFYNGRSRMASRDLSDIIQTGIINDIRLLMNSDWTRRGLWDRQYSEAWRPQVPSMLLELLSHQNIADMKHGLDPMFRFHVSRAIYKGILRFIAYERNYEAVVQPLPPAGMAIEPIGDKRILLTWREQPDPLEPSARAESYRVYTRVGNVGFDNGIVTEDTSMEISIPEANVIYSFRVTAVNRGGESMPGETLSAAAGNNQMLPVLVVNGFTRVSAPSVFDTGDMSGIAWWEDMGVPDRCDFSFTGMQYDFDRSSPWLDDDSPGWGASYASMEGIIVKGNSFDNVMVYGSSLLHSGYSFVSASREAFESGRYDPGAYSALFLSFGEQRTAPGNGIPLLHSYEVYNKPIIEAIGAFATSGGNIFISGAYIGSDMTETGDSAAIEFAARVLGYTWRTNHACNSGEVVATDHVSTGFPERIRFANGFMQGLYAVEAPDGIEPYGDNSARLYRYRLTGTSAGVAYKGSHKVIALGFPYGSIIDEPARNEFIGSVMTYFKPDIVY